MTIIQADGKADCGERLKLNGTPDLTMVSLFSGAMGLDIGMEQTGRFRTLACVESDSACCATIRANHDAGRLHNSQLRVYEGDIRDIAAEKVMEDLGLRPGDLDLLIGGPPCQSFSTAGKRGTTQDARGQLLWDFLRYIVAFRPKFFLMENVRGLMSAALKHRQIKDRPGRGGSPLQADELPGSVVRKFLADLKRYAPEYRMDCCEVNAVNYGAPQIRERLLFIGNRLNHLVDFPSPTHEAGHGATQSGLPLDPCAIECKISGLPFRTLGDAIGDLCEENPVILDFSPRKKAFLKMVKPGGNWRTLPIEIQRESMGAAWNAKGGRSGWWRRLSYDLPCPTVVTMPNHSGTSMCHPDEVRALTLRECARVQEFPDAWEFSGTVQQQYTQVGQAVPVRLGRVAGNLIAEHLDAARSDGFIPRCGDSPAFRRIYLQSHIRTRRWYKAGSEFTWTDGASNGHAEYSLPKTLRKVTLAP